MTQRLVIDKFEWDEARKVLAIDREHIRLHSLLEEIHVEGKKTTVAFAFSHWHNGITVGYRQVGVYKNRKFPDIDLHVRYKD